VKSKANFVSRFEEKYFSCYGAQKNGDGFKESERSVHRSQPKGWLKMICCVCSGLCITKALC